MSDTQAKIEALFSRIDKLEEEIQSRIESLQDYIKSEETEIMALEMLSLAYNTEINDLEESYDLDRD